MDKKENKKKVSIFIPLGWTFSTIVWIITVYQSIRTSGTPILLIVLQCIAAITFCVNAVAYFVRYKRDRDNKSE